MSNTGNMGGMGDMGGMGGMGDMGGMGRQGGAGGGGPFFADRVDLPFVSSEYEKGRPIADQRVDLASYPLRNWSADKYVWLVLSQFVETKWRGLELRPDWARPDQDWRPGKTEVAGELNTLIAYARNERADALGEILGQSDDFIGYFLDLLTAMQGYPATAKVLAIANFIGGFCAMHYKGQYQRPRPTMLCPALMPPVAVPGHASFPSGHATQAYLMVHCMGEVLEGTPQAAGMAAAMTALAKRVARNREIAGLHYPSDSAAGSLLAHLVHPFLAEPAAGAGPTWYRLAIEAARKEWE